LDLLKHVEYLIVSYHKGITRFLFLVVAMHLWMGCGGPSPRIRLQASDHYTISQQYLGNKTYILAEQEIRKALELFPDDPAYLELLALIHQSQGRLTAAEDMYRMALKRADTPASVFVNYSALLLQAGRPDEAIAMAQRALQAPGYGQAAFVYTNMGLAYLQKGDLLSAQGAPRQTQDMLLRAAEHFRKALDYQTNLPEIYHNLGRTYDFLGQGDEAIREFQAAIRISPAYVEAHFGLGRVFFIAGRKEEARHAFERVIALAPESKMAVDAREQLRFLTP
jgi:type IV pilus assembly protein PilF